MLSAAAEAKEMPPHQDQDGVGDDEVCNAKSFFEEADECKKLVSECVASESKGAVDRLVAIFEKYQEQPNLLDPHLEALTLPIVNFLKNIFHQSDNAKPMNKVQANSLFRILYILTKVRGYKTMLRFFTHEAADVEPVLTFLESQEATDYQLWETRYILLLWLSLLCIVPFDFKRIDSENTENMLVLRIKKVAESYLHSTGKERDAAGIVLARLLTRKDTHDKFLIPYLNWTQEKLCQSNTNVFFAVGLLSSIGNIYKYGERRIIEPLADIALEICQRLLKSTLSSNTLIRKLCIKISQRVGLSQMKPKIASWRYQRGHRSLKHNLKHEYVEGQNAKHTPLYDADEDEIPENLESIVEMLLGGLRDKDTIVRWSAAKGLGRIAQRLPMELAQDVIQSILDMFSEDIMNLSENEVDLSAVSDQTWHGVCLSVAELARRGLLLPEKLPEVVPWIIKALHFDQRKGNYSVGAHVRDAACYVCWSFARAYDPDVMKPLVNELAPSLVTVSVFDREINVRRAASAAFQENVGRQGLFPYGIDIITMADFFALGSRKNCYLEIAPSIAKFGPYETRLINHLATVTFQHWDIDLRSLTSESLSKVVRLNAVYVVSNVLNSLHGNIFSNDLFAVHGSLLSIAEIIAALHSTIQKREPSRIEEIVSAPRQLFETKTNSFNTFGSDLYRQGVCRLIEYLCLTDWSVPDDDRITWLKIIQSSLERPEPPVQEAAASAFCNFVVKFGYDDDLFQIIFSKIKANVEAVVRKGYALALGKLPTTRLNQSQKQLVLSHLIEAASVPEKTDWNDAEARRTCYASIASFLSICSIRDLLSRDQFNALIDCLMNGMQDYFTDSRGDVGSWVRETSMISTKSVVLKIVKEDKNSDEAYFTPNICDKIVKRVLQQLGEKIDRVRASAGHVLMTFLGRSVERAQVPYIPGREVFELIFPENEFEKWTDAASLFPKLVQLFKIPSLRLELLSGIVVSIGGLTESLVRPASKALLDYIETLEYDPSLQDLMEAFVELLDRHQKDDRVMISLFETLDIMFSAQIFEDFENDRQKELMFNLLVAVKKELLKCRDVKKLVSGIKVICGFAGLSVSKISKKALEYLLSYLVHPIPRVRKATAENFYLVLLGSEENSNDEAESILVDTNWDTPVAELKPTRNKLYPLLQVEIPKFVATS